MDIEILYVQLDTMIPWYCSSCPWYDRIGWMGGLYMFDWILGFHGTVHPVHCTIEWDGQWNFMFYWHWDSMVLSILSVVQ